MNCGSNAAPAVRRNQFNAGLCQPLIERITVVGTIPNKSSGSPYGNGFSEGSFDNGELMWAGRSHVHGEWKAMSGCHNGGFKSEVQRLINGIVTGS